MVILPRYPEWWLLNLACSRIGSVIIPGSTQLRSKDILARLLVSRANTIVADPATAEVVDEVYNKINFLSFNLIVSFHRKGWLPFKTLYKQASTVHTCAPTTSDETSIIFFTSGTTGLPKMTQHTHASQGIGHSITGKYWLDLCPDDVHWTVSDPGWAKTAYGCLYGPWIQGASVFIHHTTEKFEAKVILDHLQKYPISTMCLPPTAYRMMIHEDLSRYQFPALRHCLSAGEPLNPEVMVDWKEKTGLDIREGYGQTETTLLCGTFRCIETRPGSMGKPAPGYDVRVIDEKCNETPAGIEGDIAVYLKPRRPVGLFSEYIEDYERNVSAYRGDYYLTGDRAVRDEDGYLWFIGRSDDVIISAGYRIGPFEVESALIEHPAVAEAAVVSSPDPVRGEVVKAFVILTPSFEES
ncbi:predicted protein [Nematostella vectensis]|uniref:medium-chain acyl-CoA ligase n=1 Tax=Nematostella vectensis TaxID=45351 RepID=A7RW67_NEMVE|nr:predicted protein [Nematostella vectensis]|eukprot:XP_001636275.1 predicted protein [Nematostella vectensis]